ncbi:hypothetical protein ACU635_14400 [[Actinomadura] parvosata]|uniref:hypothetical protein n=1 Tax=[Actinomadura] parvosata TaxID=1955412 RepID=UPI00406BFD41
MQVIIPGQAERYALRLVAHSPNGPRLGTLPHHLGFEVGAPLNDVPSLKLSYPAAGVGAEWLRTPVEIAVEYAVDGGQWTEPDGGRFLRIKRGADSTDLSGTHTYECPAWSWQLRKLIMYAGPVMADGKRPFSAVSAGAILRTLIDEGQARGTLTHLVTEFSTTHDSAGQPWDDDKLLTMALEPGVDLLTLLINLAEQGVIDWTMSGRELCVYNEGTVLGHDLASGGAPVDLRFGRDIDEAPDTATLEDIASAILVRGEQGLMVEVTNPDAYTPWGRWETSQSQGGVSDQGTAVLLGTNALVRAGRERAQLTRGIRFEAARWLPFEHYRPGDHVLAPGDGGQMTSLRLRQITLAVDKDGALSGNVTLNDRFLERELKLARQAAGILAGGVGSGGDGGEPAPEQPGGRVAAKPLGLLINDAAYVDEYGYARGQITASWSPVTKDVNGVAIDPDGYELYARVNQATEPWRLIASSDDTTATYSPLVVATTYAFKVRAVAQGTKGEFSDPVVALIEDDTTPPPVPSTPALSTRLGVIEVGWDGLGQNGGGMPADFELVRVHMAAAEDGPFEVVDHLRAAGTALVADQPYNMPRWFRFSSVDRRGNESAPSSSASIATQPLVGTDLIGQVISGANIVDGTVNAADAVIANTITGNLVQANAIDTGHLRANAVTLDKLAAGSVDAARLTATAIDGKTITGAYIRTAASGRRLEFAPPGSTYPEIRFIPAGSGTNYTRLRTRDDRFTGEATFEVTSGTNSGATAASQTTIAAGYMQMQVRDAALQNDNGGLMELAESYARYGYMHSADDEQYFWFDSSGRTRHVGKWWDYTVLGPTAGIMAGSLTFSPSGTAPNSRIVSYGADIDGNPGPVCVIRRGLSSPATHTPSGSWYVTDSQPTFFRINTSFQDGYAAYWWVHRH